MDLLYFSDNPISVTYVPVVESSVYSDIECSVYSNKLNILSKI